MSYVVSSQFSPKGSTLSEQNYWATSHPDAFRQEVNNTKKTIQSSPFFLPKNNYKKDMCRSVTNMQNCTYGPNCRYAHSLVEQCAARELHYEETFTAAPPCNKTNSTLNLVDVHTSTKGISRQQHKQMLWYQQQMLFCGIPLHQSAALYRQIVLPSYSHINTPSHLTPNAGNPNSGCSKIYAPKPQRKIPSSVLEALESAAAESEPAAPVNNTIIKNNLYKCADTVLTSLGLLFDDQ